MPLDVTNYLSTEVSTSRQKKFSLAMFIDTPGLVDGDMNYPFNVDSALVLLGMCVCVCVCVCACVFVSLYASVCISLCMYICVFVCVFALYCVCMCMCIYARMYVQGVCTVYSGTCVFWTPWEQPKVSWFSRCPDMPE